MPSASPRAADLIHPSAPHPHTHPTAAGEFAGYPEWRLVRDACKPRYVGLHDTNAYKTRRVLAEMLADPNHWELVARGDPPAEAAGWAIFKARA